MVSSGRLTDFCLRRGEACRPQGGHTEFYRAAEYVFDFLSKGKFKIVIAH